MNSLFVREKLCPKCGTSFNGDPSFCGTCGASLAQPTTKSGAQPQAASPASAPIQPVTPNQPVTPRPPSLPQQTPASAPAAPPVGQADQFIGPYRLLKVLGRGGMGVVYMAVRDDGAFRKQVAIKLLLREMVNEEFVLRFRQERQVLAALDHPNIARILDGGDGPDGLPYYVMEFVEGQAIDEYCDKQALSLTGRIQIFQQVCHAVHYLNQNSIVHRDLKPSNVLVSSDGVVKLLDFGIAKVVGAAAMSSQDLTGMDVRPMTPAYASPEQIEGKQLTKASDIYSLGVILYRLLTGRMPYADFDDKVSKLSTGKGPTPPSANIREDLRAATDSTAKLKRALAGDLDSIVLKALRYNSQERYQSAAELSADLQHFLDGDPVTAHHTTAFGRSLRRIRRQRFATAAAVGTVVLAAFVVWDWMWMHRQPSQAAAQQNQIAAVQSPAVKTAEPAKAAEPAKPDPRPEEPSKTAAELSTSGVAPGSEALPSGKQDTPGKTKVPLAKPDRGTLSAGRTEQQTQTPQPPPVTPEPSTSPAPTETKASPAVPAISETERRELQQSLDATEAKVASADGWFEQLSRTLQQRNDSVPPDALSNFHLMHTNMDRAKRDFEAGNYGLAKEDLKAAQYLAEKVARTGR